MWGVPHKNADGAEGTISYKYRDFCRFGGKWRGGGSGVYSFKECIVLYSF